MRGVKIKQSQIKEYREAYYKASNQKCVICKQPIKKEEQALDHCHKTGHLRGTLHRDCNALLGKIENFIQRYSIRLREPEVLSVFLKNVTDYVNADYSSHPLHPKHKTKGDKKINLWKKRLKAAKTQRTKDKYSKLIQQEREAKK